MPTGAIPQETCLGLLLPLVGDASGSYGVQHGDNDEAVSVRGEGSMLNALGEKS